MNYHQRRRGEADPAFVAAFRVFSRSEHGTRECQQAAVAQLGRLALAGADLQALLEEAAAAAALELRADYSKILELLPDGERLLMRAGVGWKDGYVGSALVEAGTGSQAGYTLVSSEPVVLENAATERRFSMPALHADHHITSGVTVIIDGTDRPFGILGAYTSDPREFTQDDICFLQALANVLATAIQRKRGEEERERLLAEMKYLAEDAQRKAAELRGTLDNMLDGVFVCDLQGKIILANHAGVQMLGLQPDQVAGRDISDLVDLLDMRRVGGMSFAPEEHPLARALAGHTVVLEYATVRGVPDGGTRNLRLNAAPIRDADGTIVGSVAVARDVTALEELEALKDQFISVAAHELKTPVAVMKGYAQILLRSSADMPPARRKMLDAIDRGSNRIDRIVKDLLDITRFHLGKLDLVRERICLPDLVERVVDGFSLGTTKHRIGILESAPISVQGDVDRLEQVVINLVDNAIKYSPAGGDVEVAIRADGQEAIVSVRDHGVGIAERKQSNIFEQFYRAHTGTAYDYGGMGVGLYISREIVTRHGGRMWFESREGEGSTFSFSLPLMEGEGGERQR